MHLGTTRVLVYSRPYKAFQNQSAPAVNVPRNVTMSVLEFPMVLQGIHVPICMQPSDESQMMAKVVQVEALHRLSSRWQLPSGGSLSI